MVRTYLPQRAKDDVLDIPGVTSVGETVIDGERVVVVSVVSEREAAIDRIPATIDGLPVVVREKSFSPLSAAPAEPLEAHQSDRRTRWRPVPPGVEVANFALLSGLGTSGFAMTDGRRSYITSNAHVISRISTDSVLPEPKPGQRIIQPGATIEPSNEVARLTDWRLDLDGVNTVDMAWARVSEGIQIEPTPVGMDGVPTGVRTPDVGEELSISSTFTGTRTGVVEQVGVTVQIPYGDGSFTKFTDQILVRTSVQPGDSGSAAVSAETGEASGVLFAGSGEGDEAILNDIESWESESGLRVLEAGEQPPRDTSDSGGSTGTSDQLREAAPFFIAGLAAVYLFSGGG